MLVFLSLKKNNNGSIRSEHSIEVTVTAVGCHLQLFARSVFQVKPHVVHEEVEEMRQDGQAGRKRSVNSSRSIPMSSAVPFVTFALHNDVLCSSEGHAQPHDRRRQGRRVINRSRNTRHAADRPRPRE